MYFHSRADALRRRPSACNGSAEEEGERTVAAARGGGRVAVVWCGPVPAEEVAEEPVLVLGVLHLAELVQKRVHVRHRHMPLRRRRPAPSPPAQQHTSPSPVHEQGPARPHHAASGGAHRPVRTLSTTFGRSPWPSPPSLVLQLMSLTASWCSCAVPQRGNKKILRGARKNALVGLDLVQRQRRYESLGIKSMSSFTGLNTKKIHPPLECFLPLVHMLVVLSRIWVGANGSGCTFLPGFCFVALE